MLKWEVCAEMHNLDLLCMCERPFFRSASIPTCNCDFHNVHHLFGPVHTGEERVGFDIVHTSYTCSQSFHWVVLEQLRNRQNRRQKHVYYTQKRKVTLWHLCKIKCNHNHQAVQIKTHFSTTVASQ